MKLLDVNGPGPLEEPAVGRGNALMESRGGGGGDETIQRALMTQIDA